MAKHDFQEDFFEVALPLEASGEGAASVLVAQLGSQAETTREAPRPVPTGTGDMFARE